MEIFLGQPSVGIRRRLYRTHVVPESLHLRVEHSARMLHRFLTDEVTRLQEQDA